MDSEWIHRYVIGITNVYKTFPSKLKSFYFSINYDLLPDEGDLLYQKFSFSFTIFLWYRNTLSILQTSVEIFYSLPLMSPHSCDEGTPLRNFPPDYGN